MGGGGGVCVGGLLPLLLSVLGVRILPWVFGGVVGGGYFLEIVDMDWLCPYF